MNPTVIVAAAVVIEADRVLLTRRPGGTHLAGLWEFPGGKLEPDESPEECVARELREEIGVEVEVGEALDVTFWRYPKKAVLVLFYRARITRGAVQNLQVADHAWAILATLDEYEVAPADLRVLTRVRALLSAPHQ